MPAILDDSSPIGVIKDYSGSVAPSGWLFCYGQAISRTTYSGLFSILNAAGLPYGSGDGSTTFNIPDLRGRAIAGKDDMGGTAASRLTSGGSGITGTTLGNAGGAEAQTLSAAQSGLASHTHTMGNHTHTMTTGGMSANTTHTHGITDPGHGHSSNYTNNFNLAGGGNLAQSTNTFNATLTGANSLVVNATTGISVNTSASIDHTHTGTSAAPSTNTSDAVTAAAAASAHSSTQPTMVLNKIIKY